MFYGKSNIDQKRNDMPLYKTKFYLQYYPFLVLSVNRIFQVIQHNYLNYLVNVVFHHHIPMDTCLPVVHITNDVIYVN